MCFNTRQAEGSTSNAYQKLVRVKSQQRLPSLHNAAPTTGWQCPSIMTTNSKWGVAGSVVALQGPNKEPRKRFAGEQLSCPNTQSVPTVFNVWVTNDFCMNTGAYGHIKMKTTSIRGGECVKNTGELTELIQWHDSLWGEAPVTRGVAECIVLDEAYVDTMTIRTKCYRGITELYGSNEQYTLNELHTN